MNKIPNSKFQITPAMIETGVKILHRSGRMDFEAIGPDRLLVKTLLQCCLCGIGDKEQDSQHEQRRVEELEAALKPFAESAVLWTGKERHDAGDTYLWSPFNLEGAISVQHVLDARKALRSKPTDTKP